VSEMSKDLVVSLYGALRSEIHQRVDQRQQLLLYSLIGAGSFFGIGLQPWASAVTVLCYCPLAFFLSCAWAQHHGRIKQITDYLNKIEDRYIEEILGWECYRRFLWNAGRHFSALVNLPAQGLFVGSQLLSLIIGLARYLENPQMAAVFLSLVAVDVLVVIMTVVVLSRRVVVPAVSLERELRLPITVALVNEEEVEA
jgi:hypothetical protein